MQQQGGDKFFGEPALNLDDLLQTDTSGRGVINILAADKLMGSPQLYATFLLWMLSELFEKLPEVGDPEKPKLVFFFDEAHLLFTDLPSTLQAKIEQVVRLIRSKGVGVYFVTQNPLDVPEVVLGQLSNRVQHALRAFTPNDQKAVRAAAQTFRTNPEAECRNRHHANSQSAKPWFPFSTKKELPALSNARWFARLTARSDPSLPRSGSRSSAARWYLACTKKSWTANQPTSGSKAKRSSLRRPARIRPSRRRTSPGMKICHRSAFPPAWAEEDDAETRW